MKLLVYIFIILFVNHSFAQVDVVQSTNKDSIIENPNSLAEVFTVVEQMPEYIGGQSEMFKFLQEQINYPKEATQKKWQGKAFVKFTVDESGEIIAPFILKSSGYSILDEEALRIVNLMPNWIPGKQNGKAVKVLFVLPFTFNLNQ